MSHEATNWAVKMKGLRPIAKIVLWHLADCHNPTMGCFPTQEYLAEHAEISRASVNRVLDELESAGVLRREKQIDQETKRQRPTRYVLGFEDGFQPLDVVPRVSGLDTEITPDPCLKNSQTRVSNSAKPVSHSSETLTSNRTSKEAVTARASLREEFETEVWTEFPRNPTSSFSKAFGEYARLSPADRLACKRGVIRAAIRFEEAVTDEPADKRLRFHQHLHNWLAERGWEAELAAA